MARVQMKTRRQPDRPDVASSKRSRLALERTIRAPVREVVQPDGRIRRWLPIAEAEGKVLRVVLLAEGETVHNAFSDRGFKA